MIKSIVIVWLNVVLCLVVVNSVDGNPLSGIDAIIGDLALQPELKSTTCVKEFCINYFRSKRAMKGSLVIMNLTPSPTPFQTQIIRSLNDDQFHEFSIMVKDAQKKHLNASHVSEKAQNYFMFISTSKDVNRTVHQWHSLPTWNPSAQVVVLFTETFDGETLETEMRNVFEELLNHTMLNVNIISHRQDTNIMQVVTWYPYNGDNCGDKVKEFALVDECYFGNLQDSNDTKASDDENADTVIYHPNVRFPKIPQTLHGCPLKVSSSIWEPFTFYTENIGFTRGIEVNLIQTIAHVLDLEPDYYLLKDSRENRYFGTVSEGYMNLMNGSTDILIGGVDEDTNTRKYLSSSIPYYQDDETWCIAPAKPEELWKNIFKLFPIKIWFGISGIVFLFAIIIYGMAKYDEKWENSYWALLESFAITIGYPATYKPKQSNPRFMFLSLLFYGLIFSSAFHSFLFDALKNPRQKIQISSVWDAIANDVKFVGGAVALSHFYGDDKISSQLRNTYTICPFVDECLDQIKQNEKLAVAVSREHALNNPLISKSELYCFDKTDNVYSFSVAMITKRNYHLLPRMNSIIRRVVEFGLIEKWEKDGDVVRQIRLTEETTDNGDGGGNDDDDDLVVLTVNHIAGALMMLAFGQMFAILILFAEVTINARLLKNNFPHLFIFFDKILNAQRYFLK